MHHEYRFGIEEEYFLADARTRGTPARSARTFHAALQERLPEAEREMMRSQVEVSSPPTTDFAAARDVLANLRQKLAVIGREHGLLVLACGTHPLARWLQQTHTKKRRYADLMQQLRLTGQRNMVCGMHVHVEVPRPDARVDLMNRMLPFLPTLLALSTSSPFWQGRETGLAGYRLAAYREIPRTGMPDLFTDEKDFSNYVEVMTKGGAIRDASFLWWALRPSVKYPTLELRVADSCTDLNDSLAIAALYRCLVRHLDLHPDLNRGLTGGMRAVQQENLWRAQCDTTRAELIHHTSGIAMPFVEHLDSVLTLVAEDAQVLRCEDMLEEVRRIPMRGSSADQQMAIFRRAHDDGCTGREAVQMVVDWVAARTERCD